MLLHLSNSSQYFLQASIKELQTMQRDLQRSHSKSREALSTALHSYRQNQTQLVDEARLDLQSLIDDKDLLLTVLRESQEKCDQKKEQTMQTLINERQTLEAEFTNKEALFRQCYEQKERELTEQASVLREEVSEWVALKEDVCLRQKEVEQRHQEMNEHTQRCKKEQEWLVEKQKALQRCTSYWKFQDWLFRQSSIPWTRIKDCS